MSQSTWQLIQAKNEVEKAWKALFRPLKHGWFRVAVGPVGPEDDAAEENG